MYGQSLTGAAGGGGGGICNESPFPLNGVVAGTGGNVFGNTPDDISTAC